MKRVPCSSFVSKRVPTRSIDWAYHHFFMLLVMVTSDLFKLFLLLAPIVRCASATVGPASRTLWPRFVILPLLKSFSRRPPCALGSLGSPDQHSAPSPRSTALQSFDDLIILQRAFSLSISQTFTKIGIELHFINLFNIKKKLVVYFFTFPIFLFSLFVLNKRQHENLNFYLSDSNESILPAHSC